CADVTLIFARGSTELGNMGETVGPALAKQLISDLGADKVAIQGVDYPATIESNISLGSEGGPTMAQLAEKALKQCPNTKIALGGYSQGAMVAHFAVAQGGLSASDVSSAVLYGDPEDGSSVGDLPSSRLKEFCATGDGVCETHSFDITAAHLSYA
ncbi:carbohydrate esterase family 5 protein, partial [Acidomyces richmondensis BFW]